jgi:Ca2+-binding RTX toxin-like protein
MASANLKRILGTVIDGSPGDDVVVGGVGIETVSYRESPGRVQVNLESGTAREWSADDSFATDDILIDIENIIGSSFDDRLIGASSATHSPQLANNFLSGLAGDDVIDGLSGDDILDGGPGNDTLNGNVGIDEASYLSSAGRVEVDLEDGTAKEWAAGNTPADPFATQDKLISIESIVGSNFGDRLTGNDEANKISGSEGDDTVVGRGGDDALEGGAGDDVIAGGAGKDQLTGNAGDDHLAGGDGEDILRGAAGHDELRGGDDDDTLFGGSGADTLRGNSGGDDLFGGPGDDDIVGGPGQDQLFGGPNDDDMIGGPGSDTINGEDGVDKVNYSASPMGVRVDLDDGLAHDGFGASDDLREIENVCGSQFNDVLIGSHGDNVIEGLGGRDLIEGLDGDDVIDGGDGTDRVDYEVSTAGVSVDLAAGVAADGFGARDELRNLEDILGSRHADVLRGDGSRNVIEGLDGNDVIDGRGGFDTADYFFSPGGVTVDLADGRAADDGFGSVDRLSGIEALRGSAFDDRLSGDAKHNVLDGWAGNDVIDGQGGVDRVDYLNDPGGVTVDLASGEATDGFGSRDTLQHIEDVLGSPFSDRLSGDGNDNVLEGLAGKDVIDGRGGFDTADYFFSPGRVVVDLQAGRAADGHGTTDTLVAIEGVRGSAFADEISGSSGADVLEGNAGHDLLSGGGGADRLLGNGGADQLTGGAGRDVLEGGNGPDTLFGGLGADRLTGGGGADVFLYTAADQGVDRITDLRADDRIDLSQVLTGFNGATSDPGEFVNLVDAGGEAILQVDANGGGDQFVDLAIIDGAGGASVADLLSNLVLSQPAAPA